MIVLPPLPRILVIRRDNIGDLVCTTPLIAALRKMFPGAHVAALANSYNAAVLTRNPDLDSVHSYTKLKHRTGSVLGAIVERVGLIRRLRRERFDVAILARSGYDHHGLLLARQLAIPRVIGFRRPNDLRPRWLTDALPPPDGANEHEVECLWHLLEHLGLPPTPGPLRLYPDPMRVAAIRGRFGTDKALVAVHISAREVSRRLPAEKWITFLTGLAKEAPNLRPLLCWSPGAANDSRHPGDDVLAMGILAATTELGVIPCPTPTLEDLMAALAACRYFVGADGGAMHLATAVGLPAVALFENSAMKRAHWYPWQVPHEIVAATTFAVGDIDPANMLSAFRRLRQANQ